MGSPEIGFPDGAISRQDTRCPGIPTRQINLSTSLGPLDPLCELDPGQGYDELLSHSEELIEEGRRLRVLDLPTLIAAKTKAGRPKDRMALPILIATLQERNKPS